MLHDLIVSHSSVPSAAKFEVDWKGHVAQLGERRVVSPKVAGSSPVVSANHLDTFGNGA